MNAAIRKARAAALAQGIEIWWDRRVQNWYAIDSTNSESESLQYRLTVAEIEDAVVTLLKRRAELAAESYAEMMDRMAAAARAGRRPYGEVDFVQGLADALRRGVEAEENNQ